MQYRDSSSSSSLEEECAHRTALEPGEQSVPAFRTGDSGHSNRHASDTGSALTPTTGPSARVGTVKTSIPAHVATKLHTKLARHSDEDEDGEDDGAAAEHAQRSAHASTDGAGFNSTVFLTRPSATAVRKFHVLDSGDDDDRSESPQIQHVPDTPSRNKGLRDGQNVSVKAGSEPAATGSSSSASSSSVPEVRPPAPARVQTLMVKRMLPPTPSLSSSSSDSVDEVPVKRTVMASNEDDTGTDNRTAEHFQRQADESERRGGDGHVDRMADAADGTDTMPERRTVPDAPPQLTSGTVQHDASSHLASAPATAGTAGTVERLMPPSPDPSSAVSQTSRTLDTVTDGATTLPAPGPAGTVETLTAQAQPSRRTSASAARMLPPPSTESSSSSSVAPVTRRVPPPPAPQLLPPTFADEIGMSGGAGQRCDDDAWEDDEEVDEEDGVVFQDNPHGQPGVEESEAEESTNPLERDFPLQACDPDMFADMALQDSTAFSALYECEEVAADEDDVVLVSQLKVLDLFAGAWAGPAACSTNAAGEADATAPVRLVRAAEREELNEAQSDMQRAASWMMRAQLCLADAGLTAPCGPDGSRCCCGVARLSVDREARLIGELEMEPCMLPLSTIIAFASAPPSACQVVALIGTLTMKVAMMHERGLVHGALHGSNVLCSADDGHMTLTQPCGVLAQLALPADASFLSPRQAARLWLLVADIWEGPEAAPPKNASPSCSRAGRLGKPMEDLDSAEKLRAHMRRLFTASEEEEEEKKAAYSNGGLNTRDEQRGVTLPWLGRVVPEDDVYALGLLALAVLVGVPAFHAVAANVVLPSLARFADEAAAVADTNALAVWVRETLLDPVLCTDVFCARAALASYEDDFIGLVSEFITDCLSCGFDRQSKVTSPSPLTRETRRQYRDAVSLLQHPFFQQHLPDFTVGPEAMSADQSALNTVAEQLDAIHRYVYPVCALVESVQFQCGSTPYLVRAHRNAVFASRRQALLTLPPSPSTQTPRPAPSAASVMWPSLAGCTRGWVPPHPSVTGCDAALNARHVATARERTAPLALELYFPLGQPLADADASVAAAQKLKLEAAKDCAVLLNAHTIVFESLDSAVVRLNGDELAPLRHVVDKLILRHLHNCRVEILTHFRYIVLDDVTDSDVILGPCFACLVRHVHLCPTVAVACTYMVLEDVSDCGVQFAGLLSPTAKEGTVRDVRLQPYSVAYAGLTEDYAAVGLAPEHMATLPFFDASIGEPVRRHLRYMQIGERTAQDFPYAMPLIATTKRFAHRDDGESDVYVLYNELRGEDVFITDVIGTSHGDTASAETAAATRASARTSVAATFAALARLGRRRCEETDGTQPAIDPLKTPSSAPDSVRRPLIFILDAVGNVEIERCRHCTIFVVGATGSAEVRHCQDVDLFLMAKESVLTNCQDMRVFAFVTEFMAVMQCQRVVLDPLILQCPYFDAILESVLHASSGGAAGSEDEMAKWQKLLSAYDAADMEALNVVLQGNGRTIEMSGCDQVEVHDVEWLAMHPSSALTSITVDVPALEEAEQEEEEEDLSAGTATRPSVTTCAFFARYCHRYRTTPKAFFAHRTFADVLAVPPRMVSTSAVPIVKMHNLLDTSVLRLRGGLHLRHPRPHGEEGGKDGAVLSAPPDLILEQIHLGEVHIAEPVGNVLIRQCTGPLEIALCCAQNVLLEACVNVTVRVACRTLTAQDCHHCHLAAHVNTAPHYLRCGSMLTSTASLTTDGMETCLSRSGIELDVNRFRDIVVWPSSVHTALDDTTTYSTAAPHAGTDGTLHQYCTETRVSLSPGLSTSDDGDTLRVESLEDCFELLCRPVHVVPPLPGLCVGVREVAFVDTFEARVNHEAQHRVPLDSVLMAALAFLTEQADLHTVDVPAAEKQLLHEEDAPVSETVSPQSRAAPGDELPPAPENASGDEKDLHGERTRGEDEGAPYALREDTARPAAPLASAGDRYEDCRASTSADGAMAPVLPHSDSSEPTPHADHHFVPVAQLISSGAGDSDAMQRIRDAAAQVEGSPQLVDAGLLVQHVHQPHRTNDADANDDDDGRASRPFPPLAPENDRSCTVNAVPAESLRGDTSVDVFADEDVRGSAPHRLASLPVDDSLAPPQESVLTAGLSIASPLAILRAPVQASLNAGSAAMLPRMTSLSPQSIAADASVGRGETLESPEASAPEPVALEVAADDVNQVESSDENVNLGDTAREVSFSSSSPSYERVRGEAGAGAARQNGNPQMKPKTFLHLDASREIDNETDAVHSLTPFGSVIDIPYVDDEVLGESLLTAVAADDETKAALRETIQDVRSARLTYQEVVKEAGESFDARVERALRVMLAQATYH